MNIKKLLSTLLTLFVLTFVISMSTFAQPYTTVYVDATNGSNAYSGENETNNPAGSGPKATFAAALPIIANGGTIVIKAGTYNEPLDFSTGLPTATNNYTLQLKVLNLNTDVAFTGNVGGVHAVINKAALTVNITQFGTTERLLTNPGAAKVINLTAGNINLVNTSAWAVNALGAGELTLTYNIGNGVTTGALTNAAPSVSGVGATTGIILNYVTAANYTAGPEASYANLGGIGQININNVASGNTITFNSPIAFNAANTLDVINVTLGGATFASTINLGLGDIVNNGGGAISVAGLVSAALTTGAGVVDADLSSVINSAGGSISLNGGITWTGPAGVGGKNYGALYAVNNSGTGGIATGPVTLIANNTAGSGNYLFGFNNVAGATLSVGIVTSNLSGDLNFNGQLTLNNAGSATLAGGLYRGSLTNVAGGSVTVNGATTVNGILTNAGAISLQTNNLTLTTSQAHATNGGTITASSGGIIVTTTAGGNSFNGGTLSNVTINGAGGTTTFGTNTINVTNLTVTNGTVAIGVNVNASGTVTVGGGILNIGDGTTLTTQNFMESAGTVALGAGVSGVLDIKGDFSRTGGTFGALAGSLLSITGTVVQTVDGGPLFQVWNVTFTNSVSYITVNNTIRVFGLATISTATTVNFGTVNLVLNSASASIINNGIYNTTAGSGGGLIIGGGNLVINGILSGGQTMEGTGIFSYITVDVGAPNTAHVVNTLTGVKFNGILRLYTGTLDVTTVGVDFSPYGGSAKIVRHLWGAGAQPALTAQGGILGGTFNNALVPFDLEYAFGSDLAALVVDVLAGVPPAIEFPAAVNLVRNLTISATTSTGTGGVQISAARFFNGSLTVVAGARLILSAALTSTAAAGTHVVSGDIVQFTPLAGEKLVLTGGGTLTGGSGNSNIVAVDFNTTGTYSVTGMKSLGANAATNSVSVLGGAIVNLAMANLGTAAAPDWGDVTNLNVANGRVNLTGDIDVTNLNLTVGATGTLDFGNNNIWWKSAGSFNGAAASTYLATGATTGGFLQIRANSGINTGGALVPRIVMDPAAVGAPFTLTLGGNAGVSEIFTNTGNDVLELGANAFILGGTAVWNHGGTATYPSTVGNGGFNVTGAATANLGADATIPNLTVNNGVLTFSLVDNDGVAGTVPTIHITDPAAAPGVFTMTAGKIDFGVVDISLDAAAAVFAYTAGEISQTTSTGTTATDNQNGELVFNNAAAQTFTTSAAGGLSIPNLRIQGANTVSYLPAPNFTVAKRLVFGNGSLAYGGTGIGSLVLGDGCWVERREVGTLSNNPIFPTAPGVIDIMYTISATTIPVGNEMPAAGTVTLRDLYINTNVNASKDITVNRLLSLMSGTYDPEPGAAGNPIYAINMVNGSTINRANGYIANQNATGTYSVSGGPVTLIYSNSLARTTTSQEYPSTAGFVTLLDVTGTNTLTLHANRSAWDFVLETEKGVATPTNLVQFDLNGLTLNVTDTSSATLTRGVLISNAVNATVVPNVYVFGTLNVTGSLTSTTSATITNVNINANTASLAGSLLTVDLDGVLGPVVLPGSVLATIIEDAAFATVVGNAVVGGNATLNGLFTGSLVVSGNATLNAFFNGGTLTAAGDVTATVNPSLGGSVVLNGTTDQNITVLGNEAFTNLTLNNSKAESSALINWVNNTSPQRAITLALGGVLNLIDGLLVFEDNDGLILPTAVIPFVRNVAVGRMSHVVGNVTIPLNALVAIRYEYPVGSLSDYRKAVVEFPSGILTPSPLTIKFIDSTAGGTKGFPITDFPGIEIDSTANFYWLIKSAISMGISQTFNLELYAEGWGLFQDVDSTLNLLRAIRRLDRDVNNPWTPQTGTYSNFVTSLPSPYPVLRVMATTGGIVAEGTRFTFGLKKYAPPVQTEFIVSGTVTYDNADSTPLAGVVVSLGDKQDTTAADGTFSIADVTNGTYTLSASTTAAPPALFASDALAVANNFAGIVTPYTPFTGLKLVAADVNNNGIANNTDALLILYRSVNAEQVFEKGNWVFTSGSVTVNGADMSANLKGLAVGDVVPGTPTLAKASSVKLNTDGVLKINPKDVFELPINVITDMKVSAMTLKFSYPSDLVTFEGVSSRTDGIISNVKDGIISLAWADLSGKGALDVKANESLITLKFTPTENFKAGSKLDVTLDGTASELVNKEGNIIAATLKAAAVESYVPTEFALRQNYPNPFNPSTTIQYDLPVDSKVNIVVYNSLGEQVVTLVNQEQSAGVYKVNFNANGLTSGIYFYRINVQGGERNYTQTQKMILMK